MNDKKYRECPYCHNPMKAGVIHQDRYALKWIPEEKDKGGVLSPLTKGVKLTSLMTQSYVEADFCPECKKIIIDVIEFKN